MPLRTRCVPNRYRSAIPQAGGTSERTGETPSGGRHSRRAPRIAIGLAILAAAIGAFAWLQGGGTGAGPLNAIAEAAEKTAHEPGGRASMRGLISSPKLPEPLAITGRMVYDAGDRTESVVTIPKSKTGGPITVVTITDGDVAYLRSKRFGPLPDGAKWMELDLGSLQEPGSPLPANVDAKGELAGLEAVSGDVQKLGKERVRGVMTTRYRATQLKNGAPLRIEAWIDAKHLIRRMRLVAQPSDEGADPATFDLTIDFFDFGIEPQIDVPSSGEVFDATGLARSSSD